MTLYATIYEGFLLKIIKIINVGNQNHPYNRITTLYCKPKKTNVLICVNK